MRHGRLPVLVTPPAILVTPPGAMARGQLLAPPGGRGAPAPGSKDRKSVPDRPAPRHGPFGEGTSILVCTNGACRNTGSAALLSDLEDFCAYVNVSVGTRGCLGMCGQGPNVLLEPPSTEGKTCVEMGNKTFNHSQKILQKALGDVESVFPQNVVTRARLKSDAMRLLSGCSTRSGDAVAQDMLKAEELLTQAIDLELAGELLSPPPGSLAPPAFNPLRLHQLRMLRGEVLGRCALGDTRTCKEFVRRASMDFEAVIEEHPHYASAYAQRARILSFAHRLPESIELYHRALDISKSSQKSANRLSSDEFAQATRHVAKLQQRLAEQSAHGGPMRAACHSGSGAGLWKVDHITGLSVDACIYHLENLPPAEPHPFPHDMWHVEVHMDSVMREYTPVSTPAQWEAGRLDLLVKTYADGIVSKSFGTLSTWEEAQQNSQKTYSPIEDQPCWVRLSPPALTLCLPSLTEEGSPKVRAHEVDSLGIVVGGTGIAPAVQLLNELANPLGVFGPQVRATVLYSSRTSVDVLMLDELRDLEAGSEGRVVVRHTISDTREFEKDGDPWEALPHQHFRKRHGHFASEWQPFEPRNGALKTGLGEEAEFRGFVDAIKLQKLMPPSAPTSRVVLCGPRGLLDTTSACLRTLGYPQDAIIELRASPTPQADGAPRRPQGGVMLAGAAIVAAGRAAQGLAAVSPGGRPPPPFGPVPPPLPAPSVATAEPHELLRATGTASSGTQGGLTFADRIKMF